MDESINVVAENSAKPENLAPDTVKRDFLYVATGAFAAVGVAGAVWPLIASFGPSASTLASGAPVEIDISSMEPGQRVTITWRDQPVFVDYRTPKQITEAQSDDNAKLIDPEMDKDRVQRAEWLVVVGICTHLGCVPLGQKSGEQLGKWGGWYCPCHGSQYDTSGRVRKGPAPKNLAVPPYTFLSDNVLRIG